MTAKKFARDDDTDDDDESDAEDEGIYTNVNGGRVVRRNGKRHRWWKGIKQQWGKGDKEGKNVASKVDIDCDFDVEEGAVQGEVRRGVENATSF